jgi:hypothetical protein
MKAVIPLLLIAMALAGRAAERPEAVEKDTVIRAPLFSLTLPGTWKQRPSQAALVFERATDEVFTTYVEPAKPLHWKETNRVAARLAEVRQKALREISGGKATLSPALGNVKDERQVFTFSGTDPKNGKRIYVAVVGLPRVFVTIAVYRPLRESEKDFDKICSRIMSSVRPTAG